MRWATHLQSSNEHLSFLTMMAAMGVVVKVAGWLVGRWLGNRLVGGV